MTPKWFKSEGESRSGMTKERELVRTDEYISARIDSEEIILHSGSEKYFGLNEVGTQIWEALDEPRTLDELTRMIHERFDISEEQSRRDVESFIDDLQTAGLIEVSDEACS